MKNKIIAVITVLVVLISCGSRPSASSSASGPDELDLAIRDVSDYLNDNIPKGSMIVILNVQSDSTALSDYIIDELIANAVNDKIFKVVDRQQLDLIRAEQKFQFSGEVDDNLALSIGKFFGAQTIVSGKVRQLDDRYRMTIRALEVKTTQVQGQYNRNIVAGKTITALMKNNGSSSDRQTTASRTTASSKTSISEDGILIVGADESLTPLTVTATSTVNKSIYVSGGTFTMQGGTISGNTANSGNSNCGGGGVYVNSNGIFTMKGGTISGNNSEGVGGGVNINGGTFTKTGGTING
jgi:TolB-like protein